MCALANVDTEILLTNEKSKDAEFDIDRIYHKCVNKSTISTLGFTYSDRIEYLGEVEEIPKQKCKSITSIISFTGDRLLIITLNLPRHLAEKIAKDFSGFDLKFESEDMADFIGELANLIAGDLVAKLEDENVYVQMGLPSVIRGQDFELIQNEKLPHKTFGFSINNSEFYVKLQTGRDTQENSLIPALNRITHSNLASN